MFLKSLVALLAALQPLAVLAQLPPDDGFISENAYQQLPVYGDDVSAPVPDLPAAARVVEAEAWGLTPSSLSMVVPLPEAYDLRPHLPTPGNQVFNDCSAWVVAYATMSGRLAANRNRKPTEPCEIFSPAYLYSQVEHKPGVGISVFAGDDPSGRTSAIAYVLKNGCASQATVPYNTSSEQVPADVALKGEAEAKYLRQFFPQLAVSVLPTLKRIQRAIADDYVVIAEVRYDDTFRARDGMGATENSVYRWSGKPGNLHAVCIVGYDNKKANGRPALLVMNSWGKDWKNGGFCWIDEESYEKGFIKSAVVLRDALDPLPVSTKVADMKFTLARDRSIMVELKRAFRLSPNGWRYDRIDSADNCLFSLRDNGGVYFLPSNELTKLRTSTSSKSSPSWTGIPYQVESPGITMTIVNENRLYALEKEGAIRVFGRFGPTDNAPQHWRPLSAPGNEPAIDLHLHNGNVRAIVKSGSIYELEKSDNWMPVAL